MSLPEISVTGDFRATCRRKPARSRTVPSGDYGDAAPNKAPSAARIPALLKLPVVPLCRTHSPCAVGQITCTFPAVPCSSKRGVRESSRALGVGCDGRCVAKARQRETAGDMSDGEVAWSRPPDAEVKLAGVRQCIAGDGGNKARSPGRARINRKPIAQGGPGVFGQTCGDCRLHSFSAGGPRARPAPGLPCALCIEEGGLPAKLGRKLRREADDVHLRVACGPEASPKIMFGEERPGAAGQD